VSDSNVKKSYSKTVVMIGELMPKLDTMLGHQAIRHQIESGRSWLRWERGGVKYHWFPTSQE
jgi:hypothetical protein